ncbi:MAG: hypothetical protein IT514_04535 [Burkholderiales bacterium]|nr:hypothetical protein [Burkholderiales bacterium]
MNRLQWITLALAALNLALILLFPPFDLRPLAAGGVGAFQGFGFVLSEQPGRTLNAGFLQIEIFVVAVNAALAWLLLRERPRPRVETGRRLEWNRVVLAGLALNLLLVLLFPPMQYTGAVTRAALPSFESFNFLFGSRADMAIVVDLLYLEIVFVLVNAGLLFLLFRKGAAAELTPAARARLAAELRRRP